MTPYRTCVACGIPVVTKKAWLSLDQQARREHLTDRTLNRHQAHGLCNTCYQTEWQEANDPDRTCDRCGIRIIARSDYEALSARTIQRYKHRPMKRIGVHGTCIECQPTDAKTNRKGWPEHELALPPGEWRLVRGVQRYFEKGKAA